MRLYFDVMIAIIIYIYTKQILDEAILDEEKMNIPYD